jgi:FtsH-binding integral membrane protein
LKKQEDLIGRGALGEAEQQRAEFERKIAKYVGAPLLGAFSCAAGAAMWAQIFQPGAITGAPISWLLGGNPFLDGVWLFANGVICFHQGYKFFMIALANQEEVARVVREIKGLLPAAAAS